MQAQGFTVKEVRHDDMNSIKQKLGIPLNWPRVIPLKSMVMCLKATFQPTILKRFSPIHRKTPLA